MFLARKILDHGSRLIYENYTAGTYQVTLTPGRYVISLIGAGGGSSGITKIKSGNAESMYTATGGVGGVVEATVYVSSTTTATIKVGQGGAGITNASLTEGVEYQSKTGEQSSITGIPNLVMTAGAGTGATTMRSGYSITMNVGTQGQNSISGSAVLKTNSNNAQTIESRRGSYSAINTPTGSIQTLNANWNNDTVGASGLLTWTTSGVWTTDGKGKSGGVKIRTATPADLI
jgi:hypothetical protein